MQIRKLLAAGLTLFVVLTMLGIGAPAALAASQVEGEDGEEPVEEGNNSENFFCLNRDVHHPVGWRIYERYGDFDGDGVPDATYDEIMDWFCGFEEKHVMGFGQIMLAFQTALSTEDETDTYDMYLARRAEQGWGQIWLDLKLIGRPEDAGPPEGAGRPEWAGRWS
jgi:hypothetical protein